MIKQTQERIEAQKKYEAERRNQARNGIQSKGKGVAMSDCKYKKTDIWLPMITYFVKYDRYENNAARFSNGQFIRKVINES